jgi:hypothetical protein
LKQHGSHSEANDTGNGIIAWGVAGEVAANLVQEIPAMLSFFRKLKSDPKATPLHYAIVATTITLAFLMVIRRFF